MRGLFDSVPPLVLLPARDPPRPAPPAPVATDDLAALIREHDPAPGLMLAALHAIYGTNANRVFIEADPDEGQPVSQGSMTAYPIPGSRRFNVVDQKEKKLKPWRKAIAAAWVNEGHQVLPDGPVAIRLHFTFQRVLGDHVAGDRTRPLKATARTHHTQYPDLDKLTRAAGDALSGVAYPDDSQIVALQPTKAWANPPGPPGLHLLIAPIPQTEPL